MDQKTQKKINFYKSLFILYTLFVPFSLFFSIFSANLDSFVADQIVIYCSAIVFLVVLMRYLYAFKLESYITKKYRSLELWLHITTLLGCLLWFFIVRDRIVERQRVLWLQVYIAPFLVLSLFACMSMAHIGTKRVFYFYHKYAYDNCFGGLFLRFVKPFHPKFASQLEVAKQFYKSLLINLYATIFFLILFCGFTMFGWVFLTTFFIFFIVQHKKALALTDFSKRQKIVIFLAGSISMILALFFAIFSIQGTIFTMMFHITNSKDGYVGYGNFNFIYLSLFLTIPVIIIRYKMIKFYKTTTEASKDASLTNL
ncbi:MAG: hypothetical protein LBU60_05500 [Clostridiales bacterium]|nr:hypothetical protein [Clostridiales bacterium]